MHPSARHSHPVNTKTARQVSEESFGVRMKEATAKIILTSRESTETEHTVDS